MENGTANVLGMELKLTDVLADSIVKKYVNQLSEEQLAEVFKDVESYYFELSTTAKPNKLKKQVYMGGYSNSYEDTELWKKIKAIISEKFCKQIEDKMHEIIASEEYKQKVDKLAAEIVEYATEGYKKDMLDRIHERLVGNITDAIPAYCGQSLDEIIRGVVRSMVPTCY